MAEPDGSLAAAAPSGRVATIKKRGRKPAQFWVSFTALDEPYKARAAPCRHCAATVSYHKKWEQAKSHLLKCEPFLRLMRETDARARPEWFEVEVEKRRRSAVRALPIDLVVHGADAAARSSTTTSKASASRGRKRDSLGGVNGVSASELLLLQAARSGYAVDHDLIRHVLARDRDGAGSSSMEELVDKAYQRVRRCVGAALRAQTGAVPVLVVQWRDVAKAIECSVITDDKCFFLERQVIPEAATDRGDAAAAWLLAEIRRVVRDSGLLVQRCVLHAPREFVDTVASLSNQDAEGTFQIHHSPLRTMITMVDELLKRFVAADSDCNPLREYLEVALVCQDALSLLDAKTPTPAHILRDLDTARHAVDGVRSMSLADALWAVIDAQRLLDVDAVHRMAGSVGLDGATTLTLRSIVEDTNFATKLRRFQSVLQPLYSAVTLSEKSILHPSDVFVAFASVERSYADNVHITNEQRHFLAEQIAAYEPVIVQGGYPLTHLLDPAYLGELLGDAAKAKAEHKLMAMAREDDVSDKQSLYVEYTQFQVAAVQHQASGDGFVLRMLKERKKTMRQYWLTDGRRWPRLQAIALGLEQAPADAALSWPPATKRIPPLGAGTDAKMLFVERNLPLLAVSDLMGVKVVADEPLPNGEDQTLGNDVLI